MLNGNQLFFSEELKNLCPSIKNEIKIGIIDSKVEPFYKGEKIEEIISLDSVNYLVTRGLDTNDRKYTKITIYKEVSSHIEFIVPKVKELIEPLKLIKDSAIPMLKQICWNLESNENFNLFKLYKQFHVESEFNVIGTIPYYHFGEIHIYILYVAIREYMKTEDIRFNKSNSLGRYMFLALALKYLKSNDDLTSLLRSYGVS